MDTHTIELTTDQLELIMAALREKASEAATYDPASPAQRESWSLGFRSVALAGHLMGTLAQDRAYALSA